jgi:hypothetical protein
MTQADGTESAIKKSGPDGDVRPADHSSVMQVMLR